MRGWLPFGWFSFGALGPMLLLFAGLLDGNSQERTADPVNSRPLRQAAERAHILVGTAVRAEQLKETAYATTLTREYNMLEPEDAMKWEIVHPEPESFDFSQADRIVAFALEHNMAVRGHTLVWHRQNPSWLTANRYSSAEVSRILESHIKTVVGH